MATTPVPPVFPGDPVLDSTYGQHAVEPRTTQAPPISRTMQLSDEFSPEVPAALNTPPVDAPATPPADAPPVVDTPPVAAPPTDPAPEPPKQTTPVRLERVIDLGDGSGVQKFIGEGPDELAAYKDLTAKFEKAQENATRKIRELREKGKAKPDKNVNIKPIDFQQIPITDAELQNVKDLMANNQVEGFKRLFELVMGVKPEVMRDTIRNSHQREIERERDMAAVEFMNDHIDDYEPTPRNVKAIGAFLTEQELPVNRQNLEYAFEQLSEKGHVFKVAPIAQSVVPVPPPAVPVVAPVAIAPPPPPPAPVLGTPVPPPPVTVSDRSGQRPAPPADSLDGVNAAEIANLPIHEMRARIGQIMKKQSGGPR
jgi:hypothetical protein